MSPSARFRGASSKRVSVPGAFGYRPKHIFYFFALGKKGTIFGAIDVSIKRDFLGFVEMI